MLGIQLILTYCSEEYINKFSERYVELHIVMQLQIKSELILP
jgi:hypothetical protein